MGVVAGSPSGPLGSSRPSGAGPIGVALGNTPAAIIPGPVGTPLQENPCACPYAAADPGPGGPGGGGSGGTSGFSGFSGPSGGVSGFSGFSGATAASGFSGFSGTPSASGFSGFSGVTAPSGFSGFSGPAGGASGFSGVSGFSGAQGSSGFSGFSGKSGFSGFSGVSGFSGKSGFSGISGFSGLGTSGFSGFSGTGGSESLEQARVVGDTFTGGDVFWDDDRGAIFGKASGEANQDYGHVYFDHTGHLFVFDSTKDGAGTIRPMSWRMGGVEKASLAADGGMIFGSATGGSQGLGSINVSGNYYINGVVLATAVNAWTNAGNSFGVDGILGTLDTHTLTITAKNTPIALFGTGSPVDLLFGTTLTVLGGLAGPVMQYRRGDGWASILVVCDQDGSGGIGTGEANMGLANDIAASVTFNILGSAYPGTDFAGAMPMANEVRWACGAGAANIAAGSIDSPTTPIWFVADRSVYPMVRIQRYTAAGANDSAEIDIFASNGAGDAALRLFDSGQTTLYSDVQSHAGAMYLTAPVAGGSFIAFRAGSGPTEYLRVADGGVEFIGEIISQHVTQRHDVDDTTSFTVENDTNGVQASVQINGFSDTANISMFADSSTYTPTHNKGAQDVGLFGGDCASMKFITITGSSAPIIFLPNETLSITMAADGGVLVGAPTGGSQGSGTINVSGDLFKNGSAYTNPDYVFEQWAHGEIKRFASKPGATDYRRLTLEELEDYCRTNLRLPGLDDKPLGLFDRADFALEKIEEIFTYLFELKDTLVGLAA